MVQCVSLACQPVHLRPRDLVAVPVVAAGRHEAIRTDLDASIRIIGVFMVGALAAIVAAILLWGLSMALFGTTSVLWLAVRSRLMVGRYGPVGCRAW